MTTMMDEFNCRGESQQQRKQKQKILVQILISFVIAQCLFILFLLDGWTMRTIPQQNSNDYPSAAADVVVRPTMTSMIVGGDNDDHQSRLPDHSRFFFFDDDDMLERTRNQYNYNKQMKQVFVNKMLDTLQPANKTNNDNIECLPDLERNGLFKILNDKPCSIELPQGGGRSCRRVYLWKMTEKKNQQQRQQSSSTSSGRNNETIDYSSGASSSSSSAVAAAAPNLPSLMIAIQMHEPRMSEIIRMYNKLSSDLSQRNLIPTIDHRWTYRHPSATWGLFATKYDGSTNHNFIDYVTALYQLKDENSIARVMDDVIHIFSTLAAHGIQHHDFSFYTQNVTVPKPNLVIRHGRPFLFDFEWAQEGDFTTIKNIPTAIHLPEQCPVNCDDCVLSQNFGQAFNRTVPWISNFFTTKLGPPYCNAQRQRNDLPRVWKRAKKKELLRKFPTFDNIILQHQSYRKTESLERMKLIYPHLPNVDASFTLVEYGSWYGFFSTAIASNFINSTVYSFELESSRVSFHQQVLQRENITNNIVCQRAIVAQSDQFQSAANVLMTHHEHQVLSIAPSVLDINALPSNQQILDYQIVFSTTHWWGLDTQELALRTHRHLFQLARVTFLELPGPTDRAVVGGGNIPQLLQLRSWYEGLGTVEAFIRQAAIGMDVNIVKLGGTGDREIWKIENPPFSPQVSPTIVSRYFNCTK